MVIVFDTNIYIAAMGAENGLCFEVFSIIKERPKEYSLYISKGIQQEVIKKATELIKEKIIKSENFERFSYLIKTVAYDIEPLEKINAVEQDPDDDKIIECAVACKANLIITMDHHLLKLKTFRHTGIIHPKTFLYMMER